MLAAIAFVALAGIGAVSAQTETPAAGPAAVPAVPVPEAQAPAPVAAAAPDAHPLTAEDLRTYFEGLIPYALRRNDITGAVVAVVKDGQLLFAEGYGYADLKTRKPVDADRTLFRPGSVSKLFTWTAVMQQVERGKLNLDADINTYLDFKIPEAYGKPITMRHCMTHTPGFEETVTDLFVGKPEQLYPLRDYLIKRMPARIFPPGQVVAYTNYCTTLAGYIVERLSGERFADYVANHILKPLSMAHSTFVQPLPKPLQPDMATGYKTASGGEIVEFESIQAAPAGALTAPATDMARFMMSFMGGSTTQVLKPETIKQMFTRNHTLAPGLNGFDLGFYEEDRNGHRIVGHGGDTTAFHSDLHLILDANTGFFISMNASGKEGASHYMREAIFRAFLDRYFPRVTPDERTVASPMADAARVAGSYQSSRRKESVLPLLWLLGQTTVAAKPDGIIEVDFIKDISGATKQWKNVGPLTYREVGGPSHLKFIADEQGNIQYFTTDDFIPVLVFQRVAGLKQSSMLQLLGGSALALLMLTLAIWIIGGATRWWHGKSLTMTRRQFWLRLASRLGVLLFLAVAIGWVGFLSVLSQDDSLLLSGGAAPFMTVLYVIGALALLGGIAMIVNAVFRVIGGPGGLLSRAGEIVIGLVAVYGIWAVVALGLVSFNTNL
jgi:CubicO group peptidase (beta-lactamase class C family)